MSLEICFANLNWATSLALSDSDNPGGFRVDEGFCMRAYSVEEVRWDRAWKDQTLGWMLFSPQLSLIDADDLTPRPRDPAVQSSCLGNARRWVAPAQDLLPNEAWIGHSLSPTRFSSPGRVSFQTHKQPRLYAP